MEIYLVSRTNVTQVGVGTFSIIILISALTCAPRLFWQMDILYGIILLSFVRKGGIQRLRRAGKNPFLILLRQNRKCRLRFDQHSFQGPLRRRIV